MKKAIKIFGTVTRLIFEVFFTYLMLVMISMGFDKVLYVGVGAGLVGIIFGMSDLFGILVWGKSDPGSKEESTKPPLYYKIWQKNTLWHFTVIAQNHEIICTSDGYDTHDGALTGLWYLMDSMKQMNHLSWKTEDSN